MTNTIAKDLLSQADQLMRRSRNDELPVLTEMVVDPNGAHDIPDLTDRLDDEDRANAKGPSGIRREPSLSGAMASSRAENNVAIADAKREAAESAVTREQFDQAVLAKLEQMQHSVYSQVMQQLELHATGEMKQRLREALEPALMQVSRDIAQQVAEETSLQVQSIVANAVENEVARLREQIQNKRRDR
jgi:flagellar biosynthesis/type III secretory pathway protein FliH